MPTKGYDKNKLRPGDWWIAYTEGYPGGTLYECIQTKPVLAARIVATGKHAEYTEPSFLVKWWRRLRMMWIMFWKGGEE